MKLTNVEVMELLEAIKVYEDELEEYKKELERKTNGKSINDT